MIKIPEVVQEILENDEIAFEALREGILNVTAYAVGIQKQIEKITMKPVRPGTIAVAILRLKEKKLLKTKAKKPEITIQNLRVNSSFTLLVWEKTHDIERKLSTLHPFVVSGQDIPYVTEGGKEVLLFILDEATQKVKKHFVTKPKEIIENLVSVSVQFNESYLETPNILYVLFSAVAGKKINIVEIVSTRTELLFFIRREDLEETVRALNVYSKK